MRSSRKRLLVGLFVFAIFTGGLVWYILKNREKGVSGPQALQGADDGVVPSLPDYPVAPDSAPVAAAPADVVSVDPPPDGKIEPESEKEKEKENESKSGVIDIQTMGKGDSKREDQLVKTDVLTKEKDRSSNARIADATLLGQDEKEIPKEPEKRPWVKKVPVIVLPRPTVKPPPIKPSGETCPSLPKTVHMKVAKRFPDFPAFLYNTILDYSECTFVNHSLDIGALDEPSHDTEGVNLDDLEKFFGNCNHQKRCNVAPNKDKKSTTTWLFAANRKLDCANFLLGESLYENELKKAVDLINLGVTVSIKNQPDGRIWFNYQLPRYAVEKFTEANVMQWIFQIIRLKLGISYDKDTIIQLQQNYEQICKAEQPICNCPKNDKEYSFDGTCNSDKKHKSLTGKSLTPFSRIGRPFCSLNVNYADLNLPNARESSLLLAYISNVIECSDDYNDKRDASELSLLTLYMVDFVYADVAQSTHQGIGLLSHEGLNGCTNEKNLGQESFRHPWTHPIEIPEDDPVYSSNGQRCMNYIKLQRLNLNCEFSEASVANLQTSYLDLSQIYGIEQECTIFGEKGKISTTQTGLLKLVDYRAYSSSPKLLVWQFWAKVHNIIADIIAQKLPGKTDNYYFKLTRKTLIYIYQRFIYVKLLPKILGENFSKRQNISSDEANYQESVDATTIIEFSCAAKQILHRFIPDRIPLIRCTSPNSTKKIIAYKELKNQFGGYTIFAKNQTIELFQGLRESPLISQKRGFQVHNQFLKNNFKQGVDLIALDIQRARDCCLRSYSHYIEILNGRKINCWSDYVKFGFFTNETVTELQKVYCCFDQVDLYVGMSLEIRGEAELGGSMWRRIVAESFLHFKHGDHKNYANALNKNQKDALAKVNVPALIALALKVDEYAEDPLVTNSKILPLNDRDAGISQFVASLIA